MEIPVASGIEPGTLRLNELITLGPVEPLEDGEIGPGPGAGLFIFIGGGTNTVLT